MKYSCYSHVGKERTNQEDNALIRADLGIFAVADGMGGHDYGEIASKVAVETLNEIASKHHDVVSRLFEENLLGGGRAFAVKTMLDSMKETLSSLNDAVRLKGMDFQVTMGSTISFLWFTKDMVFVGHSGDSVIYRRRGGVFERLTAEHKMGPYLVGGLGVKKDVVGEVHQHSRHEGDLYLLCSDGITTHLSDDELFSIIACTSKYNLIYLPYALTVKCLNKGGLDNITAMVVIDEEGDRPAQILNNFIIRYGGPF